MDSDDRIESGSAASRDGGAPSAHIPVLTRALLEHIRIAADGIVVDATVGQGGHSLLFGRMLDAGGTLVGLDVDSRSLKAAESCLAELQCRVILIRENFSKLCEVLSTKKIEKVDLILADLGFCSAQIDDPRIGMSFQQDFELDMRLDERLSITAADIVNRMDEKKLADLIFKYGEERASRRIARFICQYRQGQKIKTTGQLAALVCKSLGQSAVSRPGRIHPATRTFQALRIAVNDELDNLEKLTKNGIDLLKSGGFFAIISFHSLEDRIVKNAFRCAKESGACEVVTPKPLIADEEEIRHNPRSRSAKLRIVKRR